MIDVHGHILRNPDDLDWIIDTGLIEKAGGIVTLQLEEEQVQVVN